MITVLGIAGSVRWPSRTHTLLDITLAAARDAGARVELLDLRTVALPIYDPRASDNPAAVDLRERLTEAHACILGTPEYHGSMSGALKNLLDYVTDEFRGKLLAGVIATGNDLGAGVDAHLRTVASYLQAWMLPYSVTASVSDFDVDGRLATPRLHDLLQRLGRDVTVYGSLLSERYQRDHVTDGGPQFGFSGMAA